MDQIELLAGILTKTGDVLERVRADQLELPTPCDEYNVETLVNHIGGWIQVFEAASQGAVYEGDPSSYRHGDNAAAEFRASAAGLIAGWRDHGFDRQVRVTSGEVPAEMAFNMTLMEYLMHGIDLAVATGQPIPYTQTESAETLSRAEKMLLPEYRGDHMPFGHLVPVSENASATERLAGFLGRNPEQWK